MEIWKDIKGYEGLYQASNKILVKSLERKIKKKNGFYKTIKERILKMPTNGSGYPIVSLSKDGLATEFHVHRILAETFIDNPNGYSQINHINGNKADNRLENLEWCTPKDNILHAYRTGLNKGKKGILNKDSKVIWANMTNTNTTLVCYGTRDAASKTNIGRTLVMKSLNMNVEVKGYIFKYSERWD